MLECERRQMDVVDEVPGGPYAGQKLGHYVEMSVRGLHDHRGRSCKPGSQNVYRVVRRQWPREQRFMSRESEKREQGDPREGNRLVA